MTGNTSIEVNEWFAIKTRLDFKAEKVLDLFCEEVFFPKEVVMDHENKRRIRAVIPRVLFIKTSRSNALKLEDEGRKDSSNSIPFWIYRYPANNEIQVIPQRSIDLLRLLTADDTTRCRIYTAKEFKKDEYVVVTDGIFKGYKGYVKRVKRNRHVVVDIEGICMVILPFLHPDMLERIDISVAEL